LVQGSTNLWQTVVNKVRGSRLLLFNLDDCSLLVADGRD